MTVIATDGRTIAADSQMTYGSNERAAARVKKIGRSNGYIFALSGTPIFDTVVKWFLDGADPKAMPTTAEGWWLLVIDAKGRMSLYSENKPYPGPVSPPFALGSGCDFALGAMYAGASPEMAVRIACKLDIYCGGEIDVLEIPQAQEDAA